MTTIPHEPSGVVERNQRWSARLLVPGCGRRWPSSSCGWRCCSTRSTAGPGGNQRDTRRHGNPHDRPVGGPMVAPFAFFAAWVVARHGFRHKRKDRAARPT